MESTINEFLDGLKLRRQLRLSKVYSENSKKATRGDTEFLTIREMAAESGVGISTIRTYDRMGYLQRAGIEVVNTGMNKARLFRREDIRYLKAIKKYSQKLKAKMIPIYAENYRQRAREGTFERIHEEGKDFWKGDYKNTDVVGVATEQGVEVAKE